MRQSKGKHRGQLGQRVQGSNYRRAMGNGAMAGLMATGRITSGFKHSGMMIVLAILVFNLIAFSPDLIGVTVLDGLNQSAGPYSPTRLNWV